MRDYGRVHTAFWAGSDNRSETGSKPGAVTEKVKEKEKGTEKETGSGSRARKQNDEWKNPNNLKSSDQLELAYQYFIEHRVSIGTPPSEQDAEAIKGELNGLRNAGFSDEALVDACTYAIEFGHLVPTIRPSHKHGSAGRRK
jgi:hypothetical protein